ncbi:hypothetical protein FRC09_013306 [Ceratobasidium sp. 395]|nr:hypothetical protein FRC09_013306 [Ceratobasidium sp. 395]
MPPIPARPPKGSNPLPLQSTLNDLSVLRTRNADLLSLLGNSPNPPKTDDETDSALQRSYDFVKSTRYALDVDTNVAAQGERVESVRATLGEIEAGLSPVHRSQYSEQAEPYVVVVSLDR